MEKHQPNVVYAIAMLILSLSSILALVAMASSDINGEQKALLVWFDLVLCAVFFCDFLFCLYKAEDRKRYFLTWGWLDLISSIPVVGPFRAARFARVARIFRMLRGLRAARLMAEFALSKRKKNAFLAVGLLSLLMLVASALAILQVETDANANIKTAEEALWWSMTTMTTVGYGDRYPVTTEGRIIASFLMVFGLGMFGAFSGFMAAWLVGQDADEHQHAENNSNELEIKAMRVEIKRLGDILESRTDGNGGFKKDSNESGISD